MDETIGSSPPGEANDEKFPEKYERIQNIFQQSQKRTAGVVCALWHRYIRAHEFLCSGWAAKLAGGRAGGRA